MWDRRPRLLYVVTLAEVGGAQSYVRDLLPAAREEFDVVVAAHGDGPLRDACAASGTPFVPLRHVRREAVPWRDLAGLVELIRVFRRVRPDIVHLNSSKAGVLGRIAAPLAGVGVRVFTAHGWAFKAGSRRAEPLYLWADRIVRPLASMIVCVSEVERQAGIAAGTCSLERTIVIPNAVDVDSVPPATDRAPGRVEVVSIGRLAAPKDFHTLVEAFSRLEPGRAHLTVLGDGPERASLEARVAERGLQEAVELLGEVRDVRPYLAKADLFVLSTRSEGMPISVLEAMAGGLPVVASAVSGLHEVVRDGETGLLAAPGDSEALAAALASLIDDAGLRRRLGRAGRRTAEERFSLGPWREAHLRLYRALLAGEIPAL